VPAVYPSQADTTRVFTFGIGDEASVQLVQGMAEAGNGKYEMIRYDLFEFFFFFF
jgi:hypothetical protein